MWDRLIQLLDAHPTISAWQVRHVRHTSHQIYLVFDETEARRAVTTERYEVTVYVQNENDLGESAFVVLPAQADVAERLDEAAAMASLVHNAPFELPGPGLVYGEPDTADLEIIEDPEAALALAETQIRTAVAREASIELSAAEIFLNYEQIHLRNSRGLDAASEETDVYVEFALLAAHETGREEAECLHYVRGRCLRGLELPKEVQRIADIARDSTHAMLPPSGVSDVLLGDEALDSLFAFFAAHASATAAYEGWSRFEVNSPVLAVTTGDRVTVSSDGTIAGMLGTRNFDSQGLPVARHTVIEDGMLRKRIAPKRYADYLNVEPTGDWGNLVVAPGTRSIQELQSQTPVLELLRFSVFEPNELTGAFSAEIRNGYLHADGERIPVKGGSVSGNLATAFGNALFSRELTQRARYVGPARVRLAALDIAGG